MKMWFGGRFRLLQDDRIIGDRDANEKEKATISRECALLLLSTKRKIIKTWSMMSPPDSKSSRVYLDHYPAKFKKKT